MYKRIVRPLLFLLPPETVHNLLAKTLKVYSCFPWLRHLVRQLNTSAATPFRWNGKSIPCRIGLSAGFDKTGEIFDPLSDYGFGLVEIGTGPLADRALEEAGADLLYPDMQALADEWDRLMKIRQG